MNAIICQLVNDGFFQIESVLFKNLTLAFCLMIVLPSCNEEKAIYSKNSSSNIITEQLMKSLSQSIPSDKIIHRATLTPGGDSFYITLSDYDFTNFDIQIANIRGDSIFKLTATTINSNEHDDHGLSFSPSENSVYFSSTRPRSEQDTSYQWAIWKSEGKGESWTEPRHIPIHNLKNKHVSHPSITRDGVLYFHSSDLDYSNMHIYRTESIDHKYREAKKVVFPTYFTSGTCTPYISPNEDNVIFASIGTQLDLYRCSSFIDNEWKDCNIMSGQINKNGLGNPSVSIDENKLFYTTGTYDFTEKWKVKFTALE